MVFVMLIVFDSLKFVRGNFLVKSVMGLLAKIFCFMIGGYAGAYADQNYDLPKIPSPSELQTRLEQFLSQYRKDP
uniref:Uncharacterized protein n=1 Tax=Panagrolaimus sp. JU765 TaxID=591449 RepID=A0AC34PV08_9BILA